MSARMTRLCLALVLLLWSAAIAQGDAPRPMNPEDILGLTWAVRPQVSPDGSSVVYSRIQTSNDQRHSSVWLSETAKDAAPRPIFAEFPHVGAIQWSPEGEMLSFLAADTGAGEGRQVFVAESNALNVRRLTSMPNGVADYRWSADSKTIAFTADERPRASRNVRVVAQDAPQDSLWTVGIDGVAPRRITPAGEHVVDFGWSPSGTEFAVLVSPREVDSVASRGSSLRIVRRSDGRTVRVLSDLATSDCDIAWSPDGATISAAVLAPRRISRRLALYSHKGGEPTFPFAEHRATPMAHVEWSADSRFLFVQFMDKTRNRLMRYEPATAEIADVGQEFINFWDYSISRDAATIALTAESQHDPPDVFIKRGGQVHRLTDFNPQMRRFLLGEVRTVHWKSSLDDRTIYGVLILPAGYEKGRPCPTIVNLHSGPHWLWWEGWVGTYLSWGQFLASNGYAVLMPNHRGSIGQGWEFAEAHFLEWGRGDYQDVIDGVDWLVAQGIADPQRLGVGGGSFGGYLTAWTITQTDRFKAAVVDAGWTDLVTSNLTNDAPEPLRIYMNGDELERTSLYRSRSPLTFVKRVRTPTLTLHGAKDRRVPTDQGRMFHRALRLRGVEAEMVIYEDEGHGLAKHENQLDSLRRVKEWFDRYVRVN